MSAATMTSAVARASNRRDGANSPGLAQSSSSLWSREDAHLGFCSRATARPRLAS
jgi:hypothetical protein